MDVTLERFLSDFNCPICGAGHNIDGYVIDREEVNCLKCDARLVIRTKTEIWAEIKVTEGGDTNQSK